MLLGSDEQSAGTENDLFEFALLFGDSSDDLSDGIQLVLALIIASEDV